MSAILEKSRKQAKNSDGYQEAEETGQRSTPSEENHTNHSYVRAYVFRKKIEERIDQVVANDAEPNDWASISRKREGGGCGQE